MRKPTNGMREAAHNLAWEFRADLRRWSRHEWPERIGILACLAMFPMILSSRLNRGFRWR